MPKKKKKKQKRSTGASSSKKRKTASKRSKKKKTLKKRVKKSKKSKSAKKTPKKASKKTSGQKKTHLTRKEMEEFRRLLLEKRRTLMGDMSDIETQTLRNQQDKGQSGMSSMPTHLADLGTDNYEQEFTLGLLESESVLLEEIDEALERINNGTYGICLGTGKPIPKARLRARPWAKYCVEYAKKIEQGLVRPGQEDESS